MRLVGKRFSRVETPLFEVMLVAGVIEEEGDTEEQVQDVTEDAAAQGADTAVIGDARIDTSDDTIMEDASNQEKMIDDLDSDAGVALMDDKEEEKKEKEAKVAGDDQVVTAASKPVTAASTTISSTKRQVPAAITTAVPVEMDEDYARKLYEELNKDIDWNVAIDHLEEEENRAIQSINETPTQKAAKRRKLNEEVKDLKRHLEIVPDEDDDVYTEATSLARKKDSNTKSSQQEEVEDLKRHLEIVPDEDDDVYTEATPLARKQCLRNQMDKLKTGRIKGLSMVKRRRYPLSRFTLDQMLNAVRLRVEEQSEMSLELLRFIRQQHQEGQLD
nr:hypothetical protein [Tanacetum cinerariifolium]